MSDDTTFDQWAILELMGHRRLAGRVRETTIAGAGFLRLDVYRGEAAEPSATQLYSPSSVYCLTPCTEEVARRVGERSVPEPVHQWELLPVASPEATPYDEELDF